MLHSQANNYDPTAVAITGGTVSLSAGTVSATSLSFAGDGATTGFFRPFQNQVAFTADGATSQICMLNGTLRMQATEQFGWGSAGADTAIDTGLTRGAAGVVKFTAAGSFTANGTVATAMSNLGPVGSHTTIQKWLTIIDSGGATGYIPIF